ncbi:hypothetical protein BH11ARM1_BH11ARM1_13310 [soil metagenome]
MRFSAYRALSRGVVLESIRRKDLWVVAILGFLILVGAGALGVFGVDGLSLFIKDLATTVLGLFSTIVAALVSTRMLPEEIKQRTLYPLLARPITRLDLLLGKLLGAILVAWIAWGMLAGMTLLVLVMFHIPLDAIMLQYLFLKMLGLALVCCLGLMFSTYMTPAGAATMTIIFAFGSSMISRALYMAGSGSPAPGMYNAINGVIPQVHLFDIGARATFSWALVPLPIVLLLIAYLIVYGSAMVGISYLKFRKQAL